MAQWYSADTIEEAQFSFLWQKSKMKLTCFKISHAHLGMVEQHSHLSTWETDTGGLP